MKIHIVGAGPTGMSLAWEIIQTGEHDVTIYDRKLSAGGSWWEPDVETRDLHAHRIVFDRAFINTQSLFSEMGISWDEMFRPIDNGDHMKFVFRSLKPIDYGVLISFFSKVQSIVTEFFPKKLTNFSSCEFDSIGLSKTYIFS